MKNMKKFVSLLLTLVMVLAMSMTAFAEDAQTYTITAPDNGHTYEVYQIFTGKVEGNTITSAKWGTNGSGTTGEVVSGEVMEALSKVTSSTDAKKLEEIKKYVDVSGTPAYTVNADAAITVPAGYYLIKDQDAAFADQNDAYTLYIVKVAGNVSIEPKTDIPKVEKKVKDSNDTTGESSDWQDSADYDIGDSIPYQITATMGDLSAYNTYWVKFTDTMSGGLTYNSDVKVSIDGKDVTSSFTIACTNQVLTASCQDVKALGAAKDSKVVVTYSCTLNEKAVLGSKGNPNTVYLEFSNNPNNAGDGEKGKTPEDKNIVFTYKVVANKITEDQKALTGAAFKLEKKLADGSWKDLGEIDGSDASTFEWKGIDDGTYKITETKAPAGYNMIDPIEFTVNANHDILEDNPQLTSLTAGDVFSGDVATGAVTANIVNYTGATLPTTGGMGTTIFYVLGAILVLGGGILLVTRKRMNK